MTPTWSGALFDTDIVKLNACIMLFCVERGVPMQRLNLNRPMSNLRHLSQLLIKMKVDTTAASSSSDYRQQPCIIDSINRRLHSTVEQLSSVWEEREQPQQQMSPPPPSYGCVVDDWEQVSGDEYATSNDDRRNTAATSTQLSLFTSVTSFFRDK